MKNNNRSDIENLLHTYINIYGINIINVTPTYISIWFGTQTFIMHYNKNLLKFENKVYKDYNLSRIYDNYINISKFKDKIRYYPNPSTKERLKYSLRESRINMLIEDER